MYNELRSHVLKLLKADTRLDGRRATEYREPIKVEQGIICTAEGSARVTIGGTQVMVGVKLEIGEPFPDRPDEGTIMVGAELLPLSNPDFELGPPSIQAVELARVVDRGIRESKAVDFKSLCIEPGEKVWLVIIDICPINDAGNLFDASALAALAALKNTRFPKVEDGKISYKEKTNKGMKVVKDPVSVTVCKVGDALIVDPLTEEEKIIDARLTVASTADGTLCALQKGGSMPLSVEDVEKMVAIGISKGKELRVALER
ncbi:exosome complex protein Rrp42 [Candidatus Woesearchaeota archaeon]|nr:exosome complex protein Rrp42 [Candidatus Woesearchaeota archaeon]